MSPPIRATSLLPLAAMLLLLGGCGDSSLTRTFGLTRDAPDEFTVVTRAPLSMPPDYTLRPPRPGAPRPQDQSDRSQAEAALVPDSALGLRQAGITPGQTALLRDAGGGAPSDTRQRVDQEAARRGNDDGFVDRLLYWRGPDSQRAVVDAPAEARRLRDNAALGQAPVTGTTPMIQDRKTGWFQKLFSWL